MFYESIREAGDYGQSNIKFLLHYFQIVSVLEIFNISLGFELPKEILFLPNLIGEPVRSTKNSFDCVFEKNNNMPLLYRRVLISLALPLFYIIAFFISYLISILLKKY